MLALAVSVLMVGGVAGPRAADTLATPESVGFSTQGLKAFEQTMHALVDEAKLAGVTTLVARRGKVVAFDAYGVLDLESKKPMAKDSIFRIASMTKPVTGVAMMMLWEQGSGHWTTRCRSTSRSSPASRSRRRKALRAESHRSGP